MADLAQIEIAIHDRLREALASGWRDITIRRGFDHALLQPSISIAIEAAEFRKITMTTYRQELKVLVSVLFNNVKSEADRRQGIYPILQGIVQLLILQKLGLDITPIVPRAMSHTTSEEERERGAISFMLEFETSCNVTQTAEEAIYDLLRVGLNYFLQDPIDDDVVDAQDLVTLQGD